MSLLTIIILVWVSGFLGGIGVLLYDYRSLGKEVLLPKFIKDAVLTFLLWPFIIHHIIWYTIRGIFNLFGIDLSNLKNIKVIKGK